VTGFEIPQTLSLVNKIKHLQMQIAAKRGKIYANPQPAATKILVKDKRCNRRWASSRALKFNVFLWRARCSISGFLNRSRLPLQRVVNKAKHLFWNGFSLFFRLGSVQVDSGKFWWFLL
jgi:hypothetical protein